MRRFDTLAKGRYHYSWRSEGEERNGGGKRFGRRKEGEVREVSLDDKLRLEARAKQILNNNPHRNNWTELAPRLEEEISPMADSQLISRKYQLL